MNAPKTLFKILDDKFCENMVSQKKIVKICELSALKIKVLNFFK